MGLQASIDIEFPHEISPKNVVMDLINNDFHFDFDNYVSFLSSSDIDDYDWHKENKANFDLCEFINSHNDKSKIGIVLVTKEGIGGEFLIYPSWLSFSLSINRVYISPQERIIDFSWYFTRLSSFLKTKNISVINCQLAY
ncbi:hypothetical protein [Leminorella grimontii]|uniref:hypothetical protein n=1 Tax=Leminorella grimontii TaxID=82981 RepID=UPI0032207AAA